MNENCASRVHWVLLNALHESDSIPTSEAWANVLMRGGENVDEYELLKLLGALREEIELVEVKVQSLGLPEEKFKNHIQKAIQATSPSSLSSGWANNKKYISLDVLTFFSLSEFFINENEESIDESELKEIENLIDELCEGLSQTASNHELKYFVQSQIKLLRHTVAEYRVRGARSLRSSFISGVGEIFENEAVIKENSEDPVVSTLNKTWSAFQKATEKAAAANKNIDTWNKILSKGTEAIEFFGSVI